MNKLLALKSTQLKQLANLCGSARTGNKDIIAANLFNCVNSTILSNKPINLLSFDLGLKNISLCHLLINPPQKDSLGSIQLLPPTIKRWSVFELEGWNSPKAFEQPNFASMAMTLINNLVDSTTNVVLIEQQRIRSGGSRSVPEIIAQINILEGMLHAILASKTKCYVESVPPAKVTSYWVNEEKPLIKPIKKVTASQRYGRTKKAKVAVVEQWLKPTSSTPSPIKISTDILTNFELQAQKLKKRDDLCDSLLQALAWVHWQRNRIIINNHLQLPSTALTADIMTKLINP